MVKITIETSEELKTGAVLTSLEKMVGAMNRYVQENEDNHHVHIRCQ